MFKISDNGGHKCLRGVEHRFVTRHHVFEFFINGELVDEIQNAGDVGVSCRGDGEIICRLQSVLSGSGFYGSLAAQTKAARVESARMRP